MIGVLTFLRARPDRLSQLIEALQGVVTSILGSPGCIAMHLHADPGDACRLMIYEQWQSKTDFDVSGALPEFQQFWQHRMDFLQDEIDIRFFDLVNAKPSTGPADA
jgi:quinol monooxygenase YgiN